MSPEGGDMTPETETRPMSEAGRLTNVFMDPKAAFADIAARPRPWVPLIIFIVMNMILVHCSHSASAGNPSCARGWRATRGCSR